MSIADSTKASAKFRGEGARSRRNNVWGDLMTTVKAGGAGPIATTRPSHSRKANEPVSGPKTSSRALAARCDEGVAASMAGPGESPGRAHCRARSARVEGGSGPEKSRGESMN